MLVEDLNLENGTVIPAGAVIVVPIQLVQTDVANWGDDAAKFNPYRFLSATNGKSISNHKESLIGNIFMCHLLFPVRSL